MPANMNEALIGFSRNRQTNAATASIAAEIWRMRKINEELHTPQLVTENDAGEMGGGNEFASNVYNVNYDITGRIEKFLSSEFAAWVMCFSLNGGVKTGLGPWVYTAVPQVPVTGGIELPYFTYVEQIRPGASDILDRAVIGCMVTGWQLSILSGPGRASSKLTADFVGTGKFASPSTITLPAETAENRLSSATLAFTLNGVNYVTSKAIQSLDATWSNNPRLDRRFHPGSGTQNDAAIGSRIEFGNRAATFTFKADFENGSTELSSQIAGTEFTGVLNLTLDANHSLVITYHRLRFGNVVIGGTDGIVTVEAPCEVLWHPTNGLFTAVVTTNTDEICEAP